MNKTRKKTTPLWPVFLVISALVVLVVILVINYLPRTSTGTMADSISVQEAATKISEGVILLDVREPSEWQEAHVEGAKLIPLGELSARMDEVPVDQDVLIICRSGNRSAQARDLLKQAGYKRVTSISGGINAWINAGLPVISGP